MNSSPMRPAAVLWDMDGTLIDSEPYWIGAERELASRFGVEWTDADGLQLVGNPLTLSAQVLQEHGVDMSVEDIIGYLLRRVTDEVRAHTPWQQDARTLLDLVVGAGIPCALVTMSYSSLATAAITRIPDAFAAVVTGDEVTHGKPHPESFLLAAERLGVSIADCVAIEDSPAGVAAALASGAHTIAVRRLTPLTDARPGLSRVRSLDGIGLDELSKIAGGRTIDDLGSDN
ncbi:HAD family hydrolase [Demequina aurantiaca]|uniref:HAD family hydrolase n=1 Tax=Demequina aurantiaca TaxID=676200 RepID=UPI000786313C|nr:HAD family phosphatase [Demequina aurantiaca]